MATRKAMLRWLAGSVTAVLWVPDLLTGASTLWIRGWAGCSGTLPPSA
ncbi:hypothetical protein KCP69_00440 [Salmonella enterica subsp. enterica]|nr:hypothetical protein KCP69_00440 [Salmonella enterica subsp. enterica]